jgi:hypothetical protein
MYLQMVWENAKIAIPKCNVLFKALVVEYSSYYHKIMYKIKEELNRNYREICFTVVN